MYNGFFSFWSDIYFKVEKVKSSDESGHKASKNEHLDQRENGSNCKHHQNIVERKALNHVIFILLICNKFY